MILIIVTIAPIKIPVLRDMSLFVFCGCALAGVCL